jgi:hypothetical protein
MRSLTLTGAAMPHRFFHRQVLALAGTLLIAACSSDSPTSPPAASLSLTAAPAIRLNPTSIHLCYPFSGGSTRCCCFPSASLKITNAGGGTLDWAATKNRSWFKISPKTGTAPSYMQVSVNDVTGIIPGHTYYGSITVSGTGASHSPRTLPVSLYRWR